MGPLDSGDPAVERSRSAVCLAESFVQRLEPYAVAQWWSWGLVTPLILWTDTRLPFLAHLLASVTLTILYLYAFTAMRAFLGLANLAKLGRMEYAGGYTFSSDRVPPGPSVWWRLLLWVCSSAGRAPACKQGGAGSIPGHIHQPSQCEDASVRGRRRPLPERIQDGHIEMREIAFVPGGHGEAVNASRGCYHGILA